MFDESRGDPGPRPTMDPTLLLLAGLAAGLTFTAVLLSGRQAVFWIALGVTLIPVEFVDRYYFELPGSVKWVPEMGVVAAAIAAFVLAPHERTPLPTGVLWAWLGTLLVSIASFLVNDTPPASFVISQRGWILFFATLVTFKPVRAGWSKDRVLAILVAVTMVSAGVNVLQRLTIGPGEGDRVTGLYSLGEVMTFFHLFGLGIIAVFSLEGRRLWRVPTLALVGWMILSLAVSNQEAAIPYLGLVLAWLLWRSRRNRAAILGTAVVLGAAMLGMFTFFWDADYQAEGKRSFSESITDPAYLARYVFGAPGVELTPGGDLLRGVAVKYSWREIAEEPLTLALGKGPGATSDSSFAGASGALAKSYPGIGRVTLAMLLGDTGVLGVVAYLAFLAALWRGSAGLREEEERRHTLVRELFVLLTLAFLLYGKLQYEPAYAWTAALMLYRPSDRWFEPSASSAT